MSSPSISASQSIQIRNQANLGRLRARWSAIAAIFAITIGAGYFLLRTQWHPDYAQRWLFIAGLIVLRELWLLWKGLASNHRADEDLLLPTLGYGNGLTIARGLLIALLAGFIFSPWPLGWMAWLPALLYTVSAILDHLDGFAARVTNHSTKLGEMLDMEYDVIGIFAAVLLAISYGQLPIWYLGIGLAREIFLAGHWILRKSGRPVYELPPSSDRRLFAGLQMGFLSVVLWPILSPPATTLGAVLFAFPMVVSFGRDWMVTSGAWDVTSPAYKRRRRLAKQLMAQWLPSTARAVGTFCVLVILVQEAPEFVQWQTTLGVGLHILWFLAGVLVVATTCFALGIAGRLFALPLIAAACLDMAAGGLVWTTNGLLLTCAVLVLQYGSGRWALWIPEERLLRHRAGERASL